MMPLKRRVLVVDDVAGIRMLISAALTDPGTEVLQASSGAAALLIAGEELPDLIFLDLALPGMNGVEILRALRSEPRTRDIPVVIVTALGHSELAGQAARAGADGLIEKPFRPAQLRAILEKLAEVRPPQTAA